MSQWEDILTYLEKFSDTKDSTDYLFCISSSSALSMSGKSKTKPSSNSNLGIGYNLGYNYFGEEKGDFTYSIALGVGINSKVGIYIEPYGEIANMDEFIANFDTGLTYLANENLQFDFSFGTGINWKMNYMSIGCSWLIKKEWILPTTKAKTSIRPKRAHGV